MDARRPDRAGPRGLVTSRSGGDLIDDIHRQQRRRLLKRAAQIVALGLTLLSIGFAFKYMADARARRNALESAQEHFVAGTSVDLRAAVSVLEENVEQSSEHPDALAALAIARAHLWLEFGVEEAQARAAIEAVPDTHPTAPLSEALLAFAEGDLERSRERLDAVSSEAKAEPLVVREVGWLRAQIAAATVTEDSKALEPAIDELRALIEDESSDIVALRRVLAFLLALSGQGDAALEALEQAREKSPAHMGLAADEALYNAFLHRELAGVASVADQLLAADHEGLSPRDQAHVQLARAVVHVRSGEFEEGLERLDRAWPELGQWNRMSHELAIATALEAGDAERVKGWIDEAAIAPTKAAVFRAWRSLARGDVMDTLARTSELPQEDPWVGYLQALALVEQRRFEEAKPWIDRATKLLPGRPELEVAAARVELRLGDAERARRKLESLAEEEPYAPRAWTGLGEAHLLATEDEAEDRLDQAQRALERAIEREPVPAEAMLALAKVWDEKRSTDPEAERQALELLERAAKTNPHLPRYKEQLGLYLADLGYDERARPLLGELADVPGVGPEALLRLIELELETPSPKGDLEELLEKAKNAGARVHDARRVEARMLMADKDEASLEKAGQLLADIVESDPKDVDARVDYAMTLLEQYDRKAAEAVVRKGLGATPDGQHGRLYLAWARIDARVGKRASAAPRARSAWLKMLAENRPAGELVEVADLATNLWLRQDRDRIAMTIAKQLTSRMTHHPEAWRIRAETELGAGDTSAARTSAERAIELDPDDPRPHVTLGHTLLRFGYQERASESYARALELAEGTPLEDEIRSAVR